MNWRDRPAPSMPPRTRRGRTFTPVTTERPIVASLRRDLEVRWSTDARGHLAVYRPPCGVPGCALPSSAWSRCPSCRKILGRCRDHGPAEPIADLRARHCSSSDR